MGRPVMRLANGGSAGQRLGDERLPGLRPDDPVHGEAGDFERHGVLESADRGRGLRPKMPSTTSVRPFLRLRKLIWSWTARTAGPTLPSRTVTIRARHVPARTTPLATRPWRRWKAITAALVFGPKRPSTVSFAPRA